MGWVFLVLATAHGLIHFVGLVDAFHLVELPDLTQPIGAWRGVLFVIAGLAFLVTAVLARKGSGFRWVVGLGAMLVFSRWNDAKFGTLAKIAEEDLEYLPEPVVRRYLQAEVTHVEVNGRKR